MAIVTDNPRHDMDITITDAYKSRLSLGKVAAGIFLAMPCLSGTYSTPELLYAIMIADPQAFTPATFKELYKLVKEHGGLEVPSDLADDHAVSTIFADGTNDFEDEFAWYHSSAYESIIIGYAPFEPVPVESQLDSLRLENAQLKARLSAIQEQAGI